MFKLCYVNQIDRRHAACNAAMQGVSCRKSRKESDLCLVEGDGPREPRHHIPHLRLLTGCQLGPRCVTKGIMAPDSAACSAVTIETLNTIVATHIVNLPRINQLFTGSL